MLESARKHIKRLYNRKLKLALPIVVATGLVCVLGIGILLVFALKLNDTNHNYEKQISDLNDQVSELYSQNQQLQTDNDQLTRDNQDLQNQIDDLELTANDSSISVYIPDISQVCGNYAPMFTRTFGYISPTNKTKPTQQQKDVYNTCIKNFYDKYYGGAKVPSDLLF